MTRATDEHPTRRILESPHDMFVVELDRRTITVRPKGTRRDGPAEVTIGVGQLYQRLLLQKGR